MRVAYPAKRLSEGGEEVEGEVDAAGGGADDGGVDYRPRCGTGCPRCDTDHPLRPTTER